MRTPAPVRGSHFYVRTIIKQLTRVSAISGYGASLILDDWTHLVQTSLEALPDQLQSVATTGHWAEDSPETAETWARIRARYENGSAPAALQRVWESFAQAFALLLDSAAPGLWALANTQSPMGPDVLGQILMEYTRPDPSKGQFLTPWPVVRLMSQLTSGGKTLVYDRLKQACQQPDNILVQAILLAGLTIEDPAQAQAWFITRLVPAALPHFERVKVSDPCVGSGRMLLGMATQFEPWMVQLGLVQFFGQDIDPLMARLAQINCQLYGLNSYALKLAQAVHPLIKAQPSAPQPAHRSLPHSPQAALDQAVQRHRQTSAASPAPAPTFEDLFKKTANLEPAAPKRKP